MDTIDSATVASAREFSTHLRELQSISNKVKKDLTGIKTQKEVEDFTLQCNVATGDDDEEEEEEDNENEEEEQYENKG
ncbi:bromo and FHA domain-containing protein DDB_G0267958-like [Dreissena polymorpha]|uniref:bromo and FHA domain-containing protein DDB_G0267958-like n=1 Tax=Dreissena polymorpha TaxID=45954 RepID=UPI002265497B|nr:bromo and FHA domain-containing protein DDB_G0267958-like [Dreissena polymorpha]